MTYINQDLLEDFDHQDPIKYIKQVTTLALKAMEKDRITPGKGLDFYDAVEALDYINDFSQNHGLGNVLLDESTPLNVPIDIINSLKSFLTTKLLKHKRNDFGWDRYAFTDNEFETIQSTINYLRESLVKSTSFPEEHRSRLLSKLEKLQAELHKKMNTLDSVLGALFSISKTLGSVGDNIKPLCDRVNETIGTVSNVQNRGDNLPPSANNQISFNATPELEVIEEE
jgi:hypothetical protein